MTVIFSVKQLSQPDVQSVSSLCMFLKVVLPRKWLLSMRSPVSRITSIDVIKSRRKDTPYSRRLEWKEYFMSPYAGVVKNTWNLCVFQEWTLVSDILESMRRSFDWIEKGKGRELEVKKRMHGRKSENMVEDRVCYFQKGEKIVCSFSTSLSSSRSRLLCRHPSLFLFSLARPSFNPSYFTLFLLLSAPLSPSASFSFISFLISLWVPSQSTLSNKTSTVKRTSDIADITRRQEKRRRRTRSPDARLDK